MMETEPQTLPATDVPEVDPPEPDDSDELFFGTRLPSLEEAGFEEMPERRPPGLVRRFVVVTWHLRGLLLGYLIDRPRSLPRSQQRGLRYRRWQFMALLARLGVRPALASQPFAVQLRRRLEMLGPTYIKLGQVLSLREDLLPRAITNELKNLLDRLPAVPYPRFLELVEEGLGRPVDDAFRWIEPLPTGSASIAQSHRATTLDGEQVILKVVKPGIREVLQRDAFLLRWLGAFLQLFLSRFQPQRVLREFTEYTARETDLQREADNCETFAANFGDQADICFPRIYHDLSSHSVLCMEFFDGLRPDSAAALELDDDAKDRIVDLGAQALVRMLYRDGFFHADLHPGNLIILPGPKAGFIDLGMVGRLDDDVRRSLLYYYFCLVSGDAKAAARYLTHVAETAPGGDMDGFRREVEGLSRRWHRNASFEGFSLGRMILESVALGGRFKVYFPLEMVLMSKALVTFEGVGHVLRPGFDVAEVSRKHIRAVLVQQWNPLALAMEGLRGTPEVIEAMVKAPLLLGAGVRFLEKATKRQGENPFAGLRGTLFGGFCLVAGAILAAAGGPWPLWALLFLVGLLAALNKKS